MATTQTIQSLKKGDYFKKVTSKGPTKTVYVYDGYNRSNHSWDYHQFEDINAYGSTKNKKQSVTTDFEF